MSGSVPSSRSGPLYLASGASGIAMRKMAPPPGGDSTHTLPPCAATSAATMARPRPAPPDCLVLAWSRPVEPLEDVLGLVGRQPRTLVGDLEDHRGERLDVGARHGDAPCPARSAAARRAAAAAERHSSRLPSRTRTSIGDPSGVWLIALLIRLPITWRSLTSSPSTRSAAPDPTVRLMLRSGATTRASCTASAASVSMSTVLPLQRPLLVQPGEQQHVLDQHAHPGGFLLHPLHDPVQIGPGERPGPRPLRRVGVRAVAW